MFYSIRFGALTKINCIECANVLIFAKTNLMQSIMKKLIIASLLALCSLGLAAKTIGYIERNGSWYYVYDPDGKKIDTFGTSRGELVGYSDRIYIVRNGSWYYVYNADGKKVCTKGVSSTGDILAVAGDTFTSRLGSWIYTWSAEGKKLSTRGAH